MKFLILAVFLAPIPGSAYDSLVGLPGAGLESGFQPGERVLAEGRYPGTVVKVLDGGFLTVQIDDNPGPWLYRGIQVAKTSGCGSDLCVGDHALVEGKYPGTVAGILPDGRLSIRMDTPDVHWVYSRGSLAKTEGCSGGFCLGDAVSLRGGYRGTVAGVFPDGRVAVLVDLSWTHAHWVYRPEYLAME